MNFEAAAANKVLRVEKTGNNVLVVTMFDTTIFTKVQARALAVAIRDQMRTTDKIAVEYAVTDERVFKWAGDIKGASAFANDLVHHAGGVSPNDGDK